MCVSWAHAFPVTLKALVWFLVLKNNENLFQERALVATKTTTSMVLALRLSRWEDSKGRPWSVTLARCSSVPDGVKMAMAQSNVHADKYCRQTYRNTNDMELAQYAHRTRQVFTSRPQSRYGQESQQEPQQQQPPPSAATGFPPGMTAMDDGWGGTMFLCRRLQFALPCLLFSRSGVSRLGSSSRPSRDSRPSRPSRRSRDRASMDRAGATRGRIRGRIRAGGTEKRVWEGPRFFSKCSAATAALIHWIRASMSLVLLAAAVQPLAVQAIFAWLLPTEHGSKPFTDV